MCKKNKRCTRNVPRILPRNDTFFPVSDPPGGRKKSTFFHFFPTFPTFPWESLRILSVRFPRFRTSELSFLDKENSPKSFSRILDPGSDTKNSSEKKYPDPRSKYFSTKKFFEEKISLPDVDQSNLEDPSTIIFRQLLQILFQSASQNFISHPDPRSRYDSQTLRSPTATQKKYI